MKQLMRLAAIGLMAATAWADEPLIKRVEPHDWVLKVELSVRAYGDIDIKSHMPNRASFDFTSAAIVFPMIDRTASSDAKPPGNEGYKQGETGGRLLLNDRVADERPVTLASDYPCGTRLGRWGMQDWKGEEVMLEVSIAATCYRTQFDEARANQITVWPETWPAEAQSCFKPQYFVDQVPGQDGSPVADHMDEVKNLLKQWTNGKDPKALPPAKLAKFLAGKVMEHVQINGNGLNSARTGELEGFNLQGAAETAKKGRGGPFDAVCLLAAVYRQAGLPCRTVIGYDVGEEKRDNNKRFLAKDRGTKGLRAWVEFALPDAASPNGIAWVPVDIVRMRKSGSRAQALDRPWPYFGTHDELDGVIPIAFQFHPPTTVVAHGSPALWGWLVTPKPPDQVTQAIRFTANTAAVTTEIQEKKRQEKDKKKKGY